MACLLFAAPAGALKYRRRKEVMPKTAQRHDDSRIQVYVWVPDTYQAETKHSKNRRNQNTNTNHRRR